MKKVLPLLMICLFIGGMGGCATLSNMFPVPRTPQENVVYAQTILTAANNSVIAMLNAELMTSVEAKRYRAEKKKADDLLNLYQIYVRQDRLLSAHDKWKLLEDILNEFSTKYILKGGGDTYDIIDSGSIINVY
jgi:hypothetical protein